MFANPKNSLKYRVFAIISISFTLFIVMIALSLSYYEYKRIQDETESKIKDYVILVLKKHEADNFTRQYKSLSTNLYDLDHVAGVALLDQNCKVLEATPLNLKAPSSCLKINKPWVIFRNNTSLGPVKWIVVRIDVNYFSILIEKMWGYLSLLIFASILALFASRWIMENIFTRPFDQVIKRILDEKEIVDTETEEIPTELRPILNRMKSKIFDTMELEKAKISLESNKQLIQLSRQLSHDIRSPLTALNVLIQMDSFQNSRQSELLNSIHDRIISVADSFLSQANTISRKDQIDLLSLHSKLELLVEEKKVLCGDHLDILVLSNKIDLYNEVFHLQPELFLRIVSNLINNSIDAIQNNAGRISLRLEASQANLSLVIKDDGPGFPKQVLSNLFKTELTTKTRGFGIGLSSAKETIKAWGGELIVSNLKTGGAKVLLTIPKKF